MKQLFVIFSLLILSTFYLNATFPPPICPQCVLIEPNDPENGSANPDSVIVDSTNRDLIYAKGPYRITFFKRPFPTLPDTLTTYYEFTISDVDTNIHTTYQMFNLLQTKFGNFKIIKRDHQYSDSASMVSRTFYIYFDDYVYQDSLIQTVFPDSNVFCVFLSQTYYTLCGKINEDKIHYGEVNAGEPQPKNKLSYTWHLNELKALTAFEITEGSREIILCIQEGDDHNPNMGSWGITKQSLNDVEVNDLELGHGYGSGVFQERKEGIDYSHYAEDLYMQIPIRKKDPIDTTIINPYGYLGQTVDGNYLYPVIITTTPDKNDLDPWDDKDLTRLISDPGVGDAGIQTLMWSTGPITGHWTQSVFQTITKRNDKGYVGICPNCMGIGYDIGAYYLDVNPNITGIQMPSSVSMSWGTPSYEHQMINMVNGTSFVTLFTHAFRKEFKHTGKITTFFPGSNNYFDDIKAFGINLYNDGVGRIATGEKICYEWDYRLHSSWMKNGFELFNRNYDAILNDSYSTGGHNADLRICVLPILEGRKNDDETEKINLIDLLVPAPGMGILPKNNSANPPSNYMYYNYEWVSHAIPLVNGIIGLMKSVDKNLCIPSGMASTSPWRIHNRAYDILTFTARKFDITVTADKFLPLATDPLKRSFSRKAAFGIPNAFRAVAHSIRNKGAYEPSTLTFSRGDGTKLNGFLSNEKYELLHLGSYNSPTKSVYDETLNGGGGNKYELKINGVVEYSMPDYDNSHGTTIVNNNLSVAKNSSESTGAILAIDGILKNPGTELKTITNSTLLNKIVITGFVEDVTIKGGNITVDDIEIFSKNVGEINGFGGFEFDETAGGISYLQGILKLHRGSNLVIKGNSPLITGKLKMEPGSGIFLNGDNDLIIDYGGILETDYMTQIKANGTQKIIVKNGGKLIVGAGALTYIYADIEVQAGGTVEFNDNTLIYAQNIEMQNNSKVILNKETNLHLGKNIVIQGEATLELKDDSRILPFNDYANYNIPNPPDIYSPIAVWDPAPANFKSTPATPGMVIIENEATLNVDNSATGTQGVSIIPGVFIKEGGTLELATDSKVNLGQFVNKGIFNINASANITLYCNKNYSFGELNFNANSVNERINMQAFKGEYPFNCAWIQEKIYTVPQIFVTDLDPVTLKFNREELNVKYTDFNTVFWTVIKGDDVRFDNCIFKMDSKELFEEPAYRAQVQVVPEDAIPVYIHLNPDRVTVLWDNRPDKKHNLQNVTISNCEFKDDGYENTRNIGGVNYNFGTYLFETTTTQTDNFKRLNLIPHAVHIEDALGITNVEFNKFYKVKSALWCENVTTLYENNNEIKNCLKAVDLKLATSISCSNTIDNTLYSYKNENGSLYLYNNNLTNSGFGFDILGGAAQINKNTLIGVKFGAYLHGGGYTTLGKEKYINGTDKLKSGNIIDGIFPEPVSGVEYHKVLLFGKTINYTIIKNDDSKQELTLGNGSNIVFENGNILPRCGYNKFINNKFLDIKQYYHLFNAGLRSITLDMNKNLPIERINEENENEVYLIGDRITLQNQEFHEHHYDQTFCSILPSHDECTSTSPCVECTNPVNHDNWATKDFETLMSNMVNPFIDEPCRQCDILNAYFYTQFHPNPDSLNLYLILNLDSALRMEILEPDTRIIVGNLLYKLMKDLKLPVASISYLEYLLENLTLSRADSLLIELKKLKLHIDFDIDPFSAEYVRLLNIYKSTSVYLTDTTGADTTGTGGQAKSSLYSLSIKEANTLEINPNPFDESTTVSYFLHGDSYIELVLYDMLGNEIMILDNGLIKKGSHKHIIEGKTLVNGSYLLVLKNEAGIISKKVLYFK